MVESLRNQLTEQQKIIDELRLQVPQKAHGRDDGGGGGGDDAAQGHVEKELKERIRKGLIAFAEVVQVDLGALVAIGAADDDDDAKGDGKGGKEFICAIYIY